MTFPSPPSVKVKAAAATAAGLRPVPRPDGKPTLYRASLVSVDYQHRTCRVWQVDLGVVELRLDDVTLPREV